MLPGTPMTVYYAFKQSEADDTDAPRASAAIASTGWEKMLEGMLGSGLAITGTWPMRTEASNRMVSSGTNALASSIILVCRPRRVDAGITDLRGFQQALKARLSNDLRLLQTGGIAPVDLAQAAIGPGMGVFSAYSKVVEPDGSSMRVRRALALINQALDEVTAEQEGEFDGDTRWAIAWYEEHGMDAGPYGRADDLSRAKNVSVEGLVRVGLRPDRPDRTAAVHRPVDECRVRGGPRPGPDARGHGCGQGQGPAARQYRRSSARNKRSSSGLWRAGNHTTQELAELFLVARSTVYRDIQRAGLQSGSSLDG